MLKTFLKQLPRVILILLLGSCLSFKTRQIEISYLPDSQKIYQLKRSQAVRINNRGKIIEKISLKDLDGWYIISQGNLLKMYKQNRNLLQSLEDCQRKGTCA